MRMWKAAAMGLAAMGLSACNAALDSETTQAETGTLVDGSADAVTANISAEKIAASAALVQEGKVYRLGLVTGRETPVYGERSYDVEVFDLGRFGSNNVTGHDDKITTHMGIGTQIDGLGHIGIDGVHYGDLPASEIMQEDGLVQYGAETIPPIATRGVLIDMARHFGVETMEPLQSFGEDDIRAAAEEQGVSIGRGDVVLFHMGWLEMLDQPEVFVSQQPGLNSDGARYLAELGVVAIGSDSGALESSGGEEGGVVLPVHALLLAEYGVFIMEGIDTRELAADQASEFFFVLGAPRFEGAVQAVVNPLAIR